MVKIVIFVAIVALACVNAQMLPGFPQGGIFNMFKNMGMMPPTVFSPEDIINTQPKPGQHFQAQYASAQSSGDKLRTTLIRNVDGEKTGFILSN